MVQDPAIPASPASTASILSTGEVVATRKRKRSASTSPLASTASLDVDDVSPVQDSDSTAFTGETINSDTDTADKEAKQNSTTTAAPPTTQHQLLPGRDAKSQESKLSPLEEIRQIRAKRFQEQSAKSIDNEVVASVPQAPVVRSKSAGSVKGVAKHLPPSFAPLDRPYQGESAEEYVKRLPPSSTPLAPGRDWIWAFDPEDNRIHEDFDLNGFMSVAQTMFSGYESSKAKIEQSYDNGNVKKSKIKKLKDGLPNDIKAIATAYGVTSGKWMLFPSPKEVDKVWRKVVDGVMSGELGPTAKVAPAGDSRGFGQLICVYTKDFADEVDVRRVLKKMKALGLTEKTIYYKADAWTHLGIESKNAFGMKASLYSSTEEFEQMKKAEKDKK